MAQPEMSWPHAPTHRLSECGAYFVTAGTYHKAHYFRTPQRSMFWRAVFSPLRGTFRGDSKLGQYSRIITTLWLILRTIRKGRAASHKCWPCFIRVPVDG